MTDGEICLGEYVGLKFTCSLWQINNGYYVRKKSAFYLEDTLFSDKADDKADAEKLYNKLIKLAQ
jgi:hypothetical protein